ncbi:hypothetical protein ABID59_003211 [Bradyrhizobium sp. S3.3.6]
MWDRMQLVAVTPCFGGPVLPWVFHGNIASGFAAAPAATADAA